MTPQSTRPAVCVEGTVEIVPSADALFAHCRDQLGWTPDLALGGRTIRDRAELWALGPIGAPGPAGLDAGVVAGGRAFGYVATTLTDEGDAASASELVFALPYAVPEPELEDLDTFYDVEHVPMLLAVPGWHRIRRFGLEAVDDGRYNRLALHDIESYELIFSPAAQATTDTDRFRSLEHRPWFEEGTRRPLTRLAG